jgi:hypothetical protein
MARWLLYTQIAVQNSCGVPTTSFPVLWLYGRQDCPRAAPGATYGLGNATAGPLVPLEGSQGVPSPSASRGEGEN